MKKVKMNFIIQNLGGGGGGERKERKRKKN